jgi:hypothetical protein
MVQTWAVRGPSARRTKLCLMRLSWGVSPRDPIPRAKSWPPRDAPSPSQHPPAFLSGRQDLNLRPPGPQPGALPDCATPRGGSILRVSRRRTAVRGRCEHTFVTQATSNTARACGRCGRLLPISDFAWRRKARGQRDNYCHACRAAYKQEHYAAHRERYIANAVRRKRALIAERTDYLIEFFRKRPCVDCGETDPLVLEFDHLGHKNLNIAQGLANRNWQSILDEIATCDVVCANCHRRRTALRAGFARAVVAQRLSLAVPGR